MIPFAALIEIWLDALTAREINMKPLSPKTTSRLTRSFPSKAIEMITKIVVIFLASNISEGKKSYAKIFTLTLSGRFKTGIKKAVLAVQHAAKHRVANLALKDNSIGL